MKLAILGYGVVGQGLRRFLEEQKEKIQEQIACDFQVKYVFDRKDFPNDLAEYEIVHDISTILDDPSIDTVFECLGGLDFAYEASKRALLAGKNLISSNKELVSTHGRELLTLAKENNVEYFFEAAVGGGIPILVNLREHLFANQIEKLYGIVNGTSNYIQTKLSEEEKSFEEILKDAQDKGFAERDPSADILGYDSARKLAIMTAIIHKNFLDVKCIATEGIDTIRKEDTRVAESLGKSIKLIASYVKSEIDGELSIALQVCPRLLDKEHPLGMVKNVLNAVYVDTNPGGSYLFYGPGAGGLATANAMVSDMLLLKDTESRKKFSYTWSDEKLPIQKAEELQSKGVFLVKQSALTDALKAYLEKIENHEWKESPNEGEVLLLIHTTVSEETIEQIKTKLGNAFVQYLRFLD